MELSVTKVIPLPDTDSGLHNSIVRLHNVWIDGKKQDHRFYRRDALLIVNKQNGQRVLRYVMGNASLPVTKQACALDYDAIDALSIRYNMPVDLKIRRASRIEVYRWFWGHPDLGIQLSIRLGVGGAFLGILGFVTGLLSFF